MTTIEDVVLPVLDVYGIMRFRRVVRSQQAQLDSVGVVAIDGGLDCGERILDAVGDGLVVFLDGWETRLDNFGIGREEVFIGAVMALQNFTDHFTRFSVVAVAWYLDDGNAVAANGFFTGTQRLCRFSQQECVVTNAQFFFGAQFTGDDHDREWNAGQGSIDREDVCDQQVAIILGRHGFDEVATELFKHFGRVRHCQRRRIGTADLAEGCSIGSTATGFGTTGVITITGIAAAVVAAIIGVTAGFFTAATTGGFFATFALCTCHCVTNLRWLVLVFDTHL